MSTRLRTRAEVGGEEGSAFPTFRLESGDVWVFSFGARQSLSLKSKRKDVRPTHSPEIPLMTPKYLFNAQDVKVSIVWE